MEYKQLVELYEKLDSTSKRLEMTYYVSRFIEKIDVEDLPRIMLLIQGKIFPDWQDKKIGMSSNLVIKCINKATGISEKEIKREWKKEGDLGTVAGKLIKKRKQASLFPKKLTVKKVFDSLQSLSLMKGRGSTSRKTDLVAELLISASPKEAKYVTRTVLDKLRLGIGRGTIRDSLVWAFFSDKLDLEYDEKENDISLSDEKRDQHNQILEKVQHAYDLTNDFGKVANKLKKGGLEELEELSIEVGKPINVMLFQKVDTVEEAFETVGKPAAFEYKYDGFRLQIHKNKDEIKLFTRRLENVTEQFPDIVSALKEAIKVDFCIIDGETVGFNPKNGEYLPFQKISQRIKRKYDIETMSEKFPVEINLFDILYYRDKNVIKEPFRKRREFLKKSIKEIQKKVVLAKQIITDNIEEAQKFYEESLALGEEGLMAKNLEAEYKPGSRVGYGVKIKSIMEPLDLVIVAAEYGEGKRSGWLTSFYLACSDNGNLKEIGKVSTGLKELQTEEETSFKDMTDLLKPHITKSTGKHVEIVPKIVIEVGYEEIQKSTKYDSGYALRFPRFSRLRTDEKTVEDINSLKEVERLYKNQRGRNK